MAIFNLKNLAIPATLFLLSSSVCVTGYSKEYSTGLDLLDFCKASLQVRANPKETKEIYNKASWCNGFINGLYINRESHKCPPYEDYEKMDSIIVKYLEDHPEKQKLPLWGAMQQILSDAYPNECIFKKSSNRNITPKPEKIKLSCKFGKVYHNFNGDFKEVKDPRWPPFQVMNTSGKAEVQVDTAEKMIKISNMVSIVGVKDKINVAPGYFDLLSYEKRPPNAETSNIRGYLLNTFAARPYLEAFIINTHTSPYTVTYFDGVAGNLVLGTCEDAK